MRWFPLQRLQRAILLLVLLTAFFRSFYALGEAHINLNSRFGLSSASLNVSKSISAEMYPIIVGASYYIPLSRRMTVEADFSYHFADITYNLKSLSYAGTYTSMSVGGSMTYVSMLGDRYQISFGSFLDNQLNAKTGATTNINDDTLQHITIVDYYGDSGYYVGLYMIRDYETFDMGTKIYLRYGFGLDLVQQNYYREDIAVRTNDRSLGAAYNSQGKVDYNLSYFSLSMFIGLSL